MAAAIAVAVAAAAAGYISSSLLTQYIGHWCCYVLLRRPAASYQGVSSGDIYPQMSNIFNKNNSFIPLLFLESPLLRNITRLDEIMPHFTQTQQLDPNHVRLEGFTPLTHPSLLFIGTWIVKYWETCVHKTPYTWRQEHHQAGLHTWGASPEG